MNFLPIVERELRVAARKRGTFALRVVAALVALFLGSSVFLLTVGSLGGQRQNGAPVFGVLTWLGLAAATSAGVFFTSDCLSEEKREGTLGFLFLTDLRGYDVVLGKLLATSLNCAFALLAIFPVLAVTQLMGGVPADEFWRTLLALGNALFYSLAAGLFVSAISHHPQKALAGTVLLLVLTLMGGLALDWALPHVLGHPFGPTFSLASPGFAFMRAKGGNEFWPALGFSQAMGWLLLAVAGGLIRRNWQEKAARFSPRRQRWRYWWKYGGGKHRATLRRKLLLKNPVTWLVCRERWQTFAVWVVVGSILGVTVILLAVAATNGIWVMWNYVVGFVVLLLYLWVPAQACQFFSDARRNGMIELLLAGPLPARDILHGAWHGQLRLFAAPAVLLLLLRLVPSLWADRMTAGGLMIYVGTTEWQAFLVRLSAALTTLVIVANLVALSWFGMWMGLISRNGRLATLKTIVLVQIVPWFIITVAAGMLVPLFLLRGLRTGSGPTATGMNLWFPLLSLLLTTLFMLGKDYFFWQLARARMINGIREIAASAVIPLRAVAPPVIINKS